MNKKIKFVLVAMIMMIMTISLMSGTAFADDKLDWNKAIGNVHVQTTGDTADAARNISQQIIGVVQVVGIAVAVIMLIVVAIKYISAAPNDKAEIKKHAVVYVVGAFVLFAASGILEIIKGFASQVK